jgi:hypothetical protein
MYYCRERFALAVTPAHLRSLQPESHLHDASY